MGKRGEAYREVEGIEAEVARGTAVSEHVSGADPAAVGEDLDSSEGEEDLPEPAGGDSEEGLDGELLAEAGKGELELLLDQETERSEHANASVLELGLAEPLEVEVVGEAERVEANVASHGSVKSRRAGEEGDSVGAVLHLETCRSVVKKTRHKRRWQ